MRPRLLLPSALLVLPLLGCPLTDPEEEGTTITTNFSVQFVEHATHQGTVTQTCDDTYTLSGKLTFIVRDASGATLDGVGQLEANQTHISTAGSPGCTPTPDRSSNGQWTGDLAGTPGDASFTVERTGSGSLPYTTKFTFAGTVTPNSAAGTLTFTQTAQGISGGAVQSSSSAQASVAVTLHTP